MKQHQFFQNKKILNYWDPYSERWIPILGAKLVTQLDSLLIQWGRPQNTGGSYGGNGSFEITICPASDEIILFSKTKKVYSNMSLLSAINFFRQLLSL